MVLLLLLLTSIFSVVQQTSGSGSRGKTCSLPGNRVRYKWQLDLCNTVVVVPTSLALAEALSRSNPRALNHVVVDPQTLPFPVVECVSPDALTSGIPTSSTPISSTPTMSTPTGSTPAGPHAAQLGWELGTKPNASRWSPPCIRPPVGRETVAFVLFFLQNYDNLPAYVIFIHGHVDAWHQDRPMPDMLWELHQYLPKTPPGMLKRARRAVAAAAAEAAAMPDMLWELHHYLLTASPHRRTRARRALAAAAAAAEAAAAAAARQMQRGNADAAAAAAQENQSGMGERSGNVRSVQGGGRGLGTFWEGTGGGGMREALSAADRQLEAAAPAAHEGSEQVGEPWSGYRGRLGIAMRSQRGRSPRLRNGIYVSLNNRLQKFNKRRRDAVGMHATYFQEVMGGEPLPPSMAHFGMAQFLVSRQRVRKHTRALWLNALNFTLFYGTYSKGASYSAFNGACQDSVHDKKGCAWTGFVMEGLWPFLLGEPMPFKCAAEDWSWKRLLPTGRQYEWSSQRYRLIGDKRQTSRFPVEVLLPTELLQEYRRNATLGLAVVC